MPHDPNSKRPLSPHLQVYKLPYNALMSIIGRAVGIGLFIALSVILIWFCLAAWSPEIFTATIEFFSAPIINLAMTGLFLLGAFVVFFYLGNGIRHVLWDMVVGVNVKFGVITGNIVLVTSAVLTLALAALVFVF